MNKILLLEDDVSLIDGLVYSLKKNGFDIEVARTVREAFQYELKPIRPAHFGCNAPRRNRI